MSTDTEITQPGRKAEKLIALATRKGFTWTRQTPEGDTFMKKTRGSRTHLLTISADGKANGEEAAAEEIHELSKFD